MGKKAAAAAEMPGGRRGVRCTPMISAQPQYRRQVPSRSTRHCMYDVVGRPVTIRGIEDTTNRLILATSIFSLVGFSRSLPLKLGLLSSRYLWECGCSFIRQGLSRLTSHGSKSRQLASKAQPRLLHEYARLACLFTVCCLPYRVSLLHRPNLTAYGIVY